MAKKYIDADRYCANLREMKTNDKNTVYEYYDDGIDLAISEAAIFPAADVVDVVRCKDCKHNPKDTWFGCQMAHCSETQRPETAWCWKGERKDG